MVASMARAPALLPPPWTLVLLMPMMASMGSAVTVIGWVGQPVTLPCSYTVRSARDVNPVCWGRGACPYSQCSDPLIQTDQRRVTWRKSLRYQLQGQLTRGVVSLTILNATEGDSGTYCCRIDVPGWFNDLKYNIELQMMRAPTTTARTTTTTTPEPTTTPVTTTEAIITLEPTTTALSTTTVSRAPTAAQTTTDAIAITTAPTSSYAQTTIPTTATKRTAKPTTAPTTLFTTLVVSTTANAQTLPTSIPTTAPTTTFPTLAVSTTADAQTLPTSIPTNTTATTMITTLTNTVKATPAITFITTYTTKTIPATTPPISHTAPPTTTPSLSHTPAPTHESKITPITTAETIPTTIISTLTIDETATITAEGPGTSSSPAVPYTAEDTTPSTTTPFKPPITASILVHTTATVTISAPVSATIAVASTTPTDASTNASISINSIPTTALSARTLPEFTLKKTPSTRTSISAIIDLMTLKYKPTTKLTEATTLTPSRTVSSLYMNSTGRFPTTANISTLMSINSERQPATTGQHTIQPMRPAVVDAEIPESKSDVPLSGNEMQRESSSPLSSGSLIAVVCGCVAFCVLILLFGLRVRSKLWNKYHLDTNERLWADGRPVELFNRTFKDGDEPDNIFSL